MPSDIKSLLDAVEDAQVIAENIRNTTDSDYIRPNAADWLSTLDELVDAIEEVLS